MHIHNEQFFQVGLLDRALISLGLGLSSKHICINSDFMVLCKYLKKLYLLHFTLYTEQLLSFSAWHCWLGHVTRKNRPRYDL